MTYYQISRSDLRTIGVAHVATTIFGSIGTFALAIYFDFNKDITLAVQDEKAVPQFLNDVANISFWAWLVFWFLALLAYLWQGNELRRIRAEHGELTIWKKICGWGVWRTFRRGKGEYDHG